MWLLFGLFFVFVIDAVVEFGIVIKHILSVDFLTFVSKYEDIV